MIISIAKDRCMGHGRCYAMAEALLTDDDEGFVAERGTSWEVPEGLTGQAEAAADACPETAITVRDS
ncbi:ferredoxin [Nocardia sp. NPDC052254]|uniref:ferredoxin n=1 Tax=Nocardia sp. NPDC052254 TaxID=3155681 RepID=UPI00343FAA1E